MNTPQNQSPIVIVCAIVLAVLFLWPAWTAARNGLSDLYARPAINYLEEKRFSAYAVSEAEWHLIEANIGTANQLMPGNPRYLESLGWLHQLKLALFSQDMDIETIDAHATFATRYFEQAVEQRPTWPYYWGNLALEHYRRGSFGSTEFNLALANASRFGPWKNDSQRLVLDLGGETLGYLTLPAQRQFILTVERGLHRQPRNTVKLLKTHTAWPAVCNSATAQNDMTLPHLRALCKQQSNNSSVGNEPLDL